MPTPLTSYSSIQNIWPSRLPDVTKAILTLGENGFVHEKHQASTFIATRHTKGSVSKFTLKITPKHPFNPPFK